MPHHHGGHAHSDIPSRCLHAHSSALHSGGCYDAGSGPRKLEQVPLEGLPLDSEGQLQFRRSDEAISTRSKAQGDTSRELLRAPQPHGVYPSPAPVGHSPPGPEPSWHLPGELTLGSYGAAQTPPFYTQTQQSGQGHGESQQTPSCPLAPRTSLSLQHPSPDPQPEASPACRMQPGYRTGAAPAAGVCCCSRQPPPPRQMCSTLRSAFWAAERFIRGGIPAERLKLGFHPYIWFSLKNLA